MLNNLNYIITSSKDKSKSPIKYTELTLDEFKTINSEFSSRRLYRGSNTRLNINSNYLIQTTGNKRETNIIFNLFNYVIDNNIAKGWEGYPKRDKSIFCSDSYDTADVYGNYIYDVYINNNTTIAYTTKTNDFWESIIKYSTAKNPYTSSNFESYTNKIISLLAVFGLGIDPNTTNKHKYFVGISPEDFIQCIKNIDNFIFSKTYSEINTIFNKYIEDENIKIFYPDITLIEGLLKTKTTFMSFFESATPTNLKIKKCKGSDLSSIRLQNNEIWFEGSALIINSSLN